MPETIVSESIPTLYATNVYREFPVSPEKRALDQDRFNRVTRLLRIVSLLKTSRGYGLAALGEACGCSSKTIQRDLNYWRDAGVPVEYSTPKKSYVLCGPLPFRLLDVTVPEATALALAEASATASGGLNADGIASAFEKIRGLVPDEVSQRLDGIRESLLAADGAKRDYADAPLTTLLEACRKSLTVMVDYDSFSSGRRVRPIEPYRVAYLGGFWMVVARDPDRGEVRKFALDRIHACTFPRPDRRFRIPAGWSLTEYTEGSVGVLRGDAASIRLHFERESAAYARARNWRFPHEMSEPGEDGSVVLSGTVAGLEEITWEVLRWGRHVTVLEPDELRLRIADEARAIAAKYE